MAVELHTFGTQAQVVAAVNSLQPSNFPGQPAQLARVQSYVLQEIAAFAPKKNFSVYVTCHRDNIMSSITIRVYPANVSLSGDVQAPVATLNDDAQ